MMNFTEARHAADKGAKVARVDWVDAWIYKESGILVHRITPTYVQPYKATADHINAKDWIILENE